MRCYALVTASVMTLPATALAPAASAFPQDLDPFRHLVSRAPVWRPCFTPNRQLKAAYQRLKCTEIKAPLDWRNPGGRKITLAISRLPARGKARGVVFTNPGGPGVRGRFYPLEFINQKRERLLDTMDIIGIDVRGTGYSTQASCRKIDGKPLDPRDRSAANTRALLAEARRFARACQDSGNEKLPSQYVPTAQTVYDLEWIRRNLRTSRGGKVDKINMIGYSAGTWLGAYYARKWPKAVGRFVLDSVVDFSGTWQEHLGRQPAAYQKRFETFADWAARYHAVFGLGRTRKAVLRRYERIRAAVARRGRVACISTLGGLESLGPRELDTKIVASLRTKDQFIDLGRFLQALSPLASGSRAGAAPSAVDPDAGGDATFVGITCNDTAFTRTPARQAAYSKQVGRRYPLHGYSLITDPCAYWKRHSGRLALRRPVGDGLPRVLMIQSTGDPAAPYGGALRAHRAYRASRLITVVHEGDHGIYSRTPNTCVNGIVERYLIDGVYPARDRTCPGLPLPVPRAKGRRS